MTSVSTTTTRPKSTRAQTATAILTSVLLLVVVGALAAGWSLLSSVDRMAAQDAPSAVTQWLCLPYTDFVLDQSRAGLTPTQITDALQVSEYRAGGQPGVTAREADITAPRLDSPEACGYPFEIVDAAGLSGVPSGPPSP